MEWILERKPRPAVSTVGWQTSRTSTQAILTPADKVYHGPIEVHLPAASSYVVLTAQIVCRSWLWNHPRLRPFHNSRSRKPLDRPGGRTGRSPSRRYPKPITPNTSEQPRRYLRPLLLHLTRRRVVCPTERDRRCKQNPPRTLIRARKRASLCP